MGVTKREREKRLRARIEESIIKSDWREGTAGLSCCQLGNVSNSNEVSFMLPCINLATIILDSANANSSWNTSISILAGVQTLRECNRVST